MVEAISYHREAAVATLQAAIRYHVRYSLGKEWQHLSGPELFRAVALAVRDIDLAIEAALQFTRRSVPQVNATRGRACCQQRAVRRKEHLQRRLGWQRNAVTQFCRLEVEDDREARFFASFATDRTHADRQPLPVVTERERTDEARLLG